MPVKESTHTELSDSDFDELVSEEDDNAEAKPNLSVDTALLLRGSLQRPRHSTLNTKHLHDLIHFGNVDLDPAYQRDVVWSEAKMIGLIQSLFLNYYIPPIIFAVQQNLVEDTELRICIDGKQRCTSILNFMDGKIPFISPSTKQKFWLSKFGNQKSGTQLPETLKRRFEQITIQVVEYDGIKDEQQRDIFQRVQMGVALSAPEKLQAIPGPWTEWIIELQKNYITEDDTLGDRMNWDTKRGRPFQALAASIMLVSDPERYSHPTFTTMGKFLERWDPPDPQFKRKIEMTLSLFVNIVLNHYSEAFKTATERVAPVEFWFIVLLISTRMGAISLENMAIAIGQMRYDIRRNNVDIRSNTRVVKDLHDLLAKIQKKRHLGEHVAAEDYEGDDTHTRERGALKRTRLAEEEDPSYHGQGITLRDAVEAGPSTQTKVHKPEAKKEPTRPSYIEPPFATVARPPPSKMDAPAPAAPNGGQAESTVIPHTQISSGGSTATQRLETGQAQQPNHAPKYRPINDRPEAQRHPQHELSQSPAMRQAPQTQQKSQQKSQGT